ncbi:MAG TPA: family 16 glycoside hydrolase [Pirellulales bacterium]|nr:family 16 glycoside hydrolase [Pirellulales bacterium]
MKLSVEEFARDVVSCGLLTQADLEACKATSKGSAEATELAKRLVAAGKLTKYQAANAVQGKAKKLVFGEYTILAAIGAGGMGQVFKAEHRRMKRIVALKILPPAFVKSADAVARFQQEVHAAARLEHINIVTAHDAGEAHGVHFLVVQYVDGRDLASLVEERGPLPVRQAVDYIRQAAKGLAYAHSRGVIHRDVKPANLLLNIEGTVKILDMGIARLDDVLPAAGKPPMTAAGEMLGTVDFMAPEQAEEAHNVDGRADIYSLGCTLYFLLTGEAPYRGATLPQKLLAHRTQPIPSLAQRRADVPPALDGLFARMVAKRPEDRFQSMPEVVAAFESLGNMAPSTANTAWAAPVRAMIDGVTTLATAPGDVTSGATKTVASLLDHDVVRKTWGATAKVTGALFATIIAPILVTFILKYFDKPPVEPASASVSATSGGTAAETSLSPQNSTTGNTAQPGAPRALNLVAGKPLNLLPAIDTARDVLRGSWSIRNGVLHTPETTRGHSAQIRLPVVPPTEYDLILSMSRQHSNYGVSVGVLVDDRYQAEVIMDSTSKEGRCWGLEIIDGKTSATNGTRVTNKPSFSATPMQAVIKVRRGEIEVSCDGAPVFDWRGSGRQLSLPKNWTELLDEPALRLVTLADLDVHQITLVPGGGDWTELFNEQNLDGWIDDDLKAWQVDARKGELIGTFDNHNRWLHSKNLYGDFRLRLQFDMKPGTNAGVAILAGKGDKPLDHLQLELCNDLSKSGNVATGTLHNVGLGKRKNIAPASPAQLKPPGTWNELEMEFHKNRLRVWLNGEWLHDRDLTKAAAAKDAVPALKRKTGRISLQVASGQIRFRNVVIHERKP